MFKHLRAPERLFRIGQWAIALLFAFFLTQVGSALIADLPSMSHYPEHESFRDKAAIAKVEQEMAPTEAALRKVQQQIQQKERLLNENEQSYEKAKESFNNWLAARSTTEQSEQNPQVLAKTRQLDAMLKAQAGIQADIAALGDQRAAIEESRRPFQERIAELNWQADEAYARAVRKGELKAFGIRLAFVLPLLIIAIWLFRAHRRGRQWPFVWGFILFALFAFFFELVPYLPSFGGYVRYGVGAILTFVVGRALINALQRYLERKAQEQQAPQEERKQEISYEKALQAMAHNRCPSCERAIPAVEGAQVDFCMHCGLKLNNKCPVCGLRKNAFFLFCPSCGSAAENSPTGGTIKQA